MRSPNDSRLRPRNRTALESESKADHLGLTIRYRTGKWSVNDPCWDSRRPGDLTPEKWPREYSNLLAERKQQMPRRYPPKVCRLAIELARAGTKVKQLAANFQMSDASIYNWLKQDCIESWRGRGSDDESAARAGRGAGAHSPAED